MKTLTLNDKGQITIPAPLRKQLGISAGSQVRLYSEPGEKILHLIPTGSIKEALGIFPKPSRARTLEELEEGLQGAVAKEVMSYEGN